MKLRKSRKRKFPVWCNTQLRKVLTQEQIDWLVSYENETTFEPMHLDEIANGKMDFLEAAISNRDWFEVWKNDAFLAISVIPGELWND